MRRLGLRGAVRGKPHRTTDPDAQGARRLPDLVERDGPRRPGDGDLGSPGVHLRARPPRRSRRPARVQGVLATPPCRSEGRGSPGARLAFSRPAGAPPSSAGRSASTGPGPVAVLVGPPAEFEEQFRRQPPRPFGPAEAVRPPLLGARRPPREPPKPNELSLHRTLTLRRFNLHPREPGARRPWSNWPRRRRPSGHRSWQTSALPPAVFGALAGRARPGGSLGFEVETVVPPAGQGIRFEIRS